MTHRWLAIAAIVCAATVRAQTPPPPAQPAPPKAPPAKVEAPDESLIEFLGSDDVGDAAWWEFLKRASARGTHPPPPPPPQEAKR